MKIRFLLAAVLFVLFITLSYVSSPMSKGSIFIFTGLIMLFVLVFSICLFPWIKGNWKDKLTKATSYGTLTITATFLLGYISAVLISSYL